MALQALYDESFSHLSLVTTRLTPYIMQLKKKKKKKDKTLSQLNGLAQNVIPSPWVSEKHPCIAHPE